MAEENENMNNQQHETSATGAREMPKSYSANSPSTTGTGSHNAQQQQAAQHSNNAMRGQTNTGAQWRRPNISRCSTRRRRSRCEQAAMPKTTPSMTI